jgi:hypothetical protein
MTTDAPRVRFDLVDDCETAALKRQYPNAPIGWTSCTGLAEVEHYGRPMCRACQARWHDAMLEEVRRG